MTAGELQAHFGSVIVVVAVVGQGRVVIVTIVAVTMHATDVTAVA